MPADASADFIATTWDEQIVPALSQYIRIPNKSPLFDPEWEAHGHMDRAVELIADFCRARQIAGMKLEVLRLPGRTPLIFMEIPAFEGGGSDAEDTVLLYGHLDKQPEFSGWAEGLAPFEPVLRDGKLYGRGAADDGYAAFAATTAIEALQREGRAHARCVVLIEACEESGSNDLPAYVEHLRERLGAVSLVICLDSGCGDYERLWSTTSLRGIVNGDLCVEVLREGVHSGDASGVVASSFRIARALLSRLEDEKTGKIKPKFLYGAIPKQRVTQVKATAKVLKGTFVAGYPWVEGMRPVDRDPSVLLTNRTWRPALSVTGAAGLPDLQSAGNVLRPSTTLKLSIRVPPTVDAVRATKQLQQLLEKDAPYGARVRFVGEKASQGWNAPALAPWLERALTEASKAAFGKPACFLGEGGSIPFMAMLGEKFPNAQFFITGVLGPASNAHGPNEFLHLLTGRRVTQSVSYVLHAHARRAPEGAGRKQRKSAKKRGVR
ncbi:MAG TPA: M20 family metallopeptidase [Polyangiales bacterium]|nr:M20 family metallopeptidase [Polyangiales bacterium]